MDRNTIIGLTLIFILFIVWQQFLAPSREELEAEKRRQDSIALAERRADSLARIALPDTGTVPVMDQPEVEISDSLRVDQLSQTFGPFAVAAEGMEQIETLENDLFKVTFTSKGGRIKEVVLKNYQKVAEDEKKKEIKSELKLLEDEKNRFEYFLPVASLPSGGVNTHDLFFSVSTTGQSITFRADVGEGRFFEQKYTLSPETYRIDYQLRMEGLNNILAQNADAIQLNWLNYLDKLEKNTDYEKRYSTIYFRPAGDDVDYCSLTRNDKEDAGGNPVKWVSHTNQFFNSTLMGKDNFQSAVMEVEVLEEGNEDMKRLRTQIAIPYNHTSSETFKMDLYVGPNEFNGLRAFGEGLEDVIPFGWSIFGTINRWVIRPLFTFLSSLIGSKGIVILFLTLIVKMLLYPLTYRMLYSQSKMGALKPQMEGMRARFKDDPQKLQMETMQMYREFGVNPLGGCLPMVLQMPIWFALYRFFPAAIEFRQASFLWATDLSSYDVFFRLPFEVPFGIGSHVSLFTLLWAVTTLVYTYYNTKDMDMSANPAMKYMQYIMPVFFLGFFNSFASGLTAYLLFSNVINIAQTIVTKNYIIDQEKIRHEMEEYRKKPKKKGSFQDRLATALKEQQKIQAQREAEKQRGKKK